jgi:hypothetical protein
MKTYGRVEVNLHAFLNSTLDGGEWSASQTRRLTPRERDSGTHWIGGWMGLGTGLDTATKRKHTYHCRESNLGYSARTLVTVITELSRILPNMSKGKFVPVLNQVPSHEDALGSGGIAPCIIDLGTRWR